MDNLTAITLFWATLLVAASVFGIVCIKYGEYTTGNHGEHATLTV